MIPPEPEPPTPVATRTILFAKQGSARFGIYSLTYTFNGETVTLGTDLNENADILNYYWVFDNVPVGATLGGSYFQVVDGVRTYGNINNLEFTPASDTTQSGVTYYFNPKTFVVPDVATQEHWACGVIL